jgi:hypothetical protein
MFAALELRRRQPDAHTPLGTAPPNTGFGVSVAHEPKQPRCVQPRTNKECVATPIEMAFAPFSVYGLQCSEQLRGSPSKLSGKCR